MPVRLSRTGNNSGGQGNILGTFPRERLNYCLFPLVLINYLTQLLTGKNHDGQVDFFYILFRGRQNFPVISTPDQPNVKPPPPYGRGLNIILGNLHSKHLIISMFIES